MTGAGVNNLIPFVHVADPARSIAFYEMLGFEVKDTFGPPNGRIDWAALESDGAQLMLHRASAPVERDKQAVFFYLYSEDLHALRNHLVVNGVVVGEIVDGSPGPEQEMGLADPDGYCLMIAQT